MDAISADAARRGLTDEILEAERARDAARRIRALRRGVTLGGGATIKDLIAEGRL